MRPLLCLLLVSAVCVSASAAPVLQLDYITLLGVDSSSGVTYFKGIPYAAPPLGALRFLPPQPHAVVSGVFNATVFGPMCPGGFGTPNFPADEDCLFINVWSPSSAMSTNTSRLPVMVWIHGGGFTGDSTQQYDAEAFVSNGLDVVVVSMEYRLGALGFLSNEAVLAEGHGANHGLLDQQFALHWVQKYVSQFGGDPARVTVFGESAGAISIAMQMLAYGGSQSALFSRAILESGAFEPQMLGPDEQRAQTTTLAAAVGCSTAVGAQQLACLRAVPYATLLAASASMSWGPTVDGVMFCGAAYALLAAGAVMNIPVLIGTVTNEGLGWGPSSMTAAAIASAFHLSLENATTVLNAYPVDAFASWGLLNVFMAASELAGDMMLVCPSELFAEAVSAALPTHTYRYRWNHHALSQGVNGTFVPHFSEVAFVFKFRNGLVSPYEYTLSDQTQKLWHAFAVSASADPNTAQLGPAGVPTWPTFNRDSSPAFQQLLFDNTAISTEVDGAYMANHTKRCELWRQLFAEAAAAYPPACPSNPPQPAGHTLSDGAIAGIAAGGGALVLALLALLCVRHRAASKRAAAAPLTSPYSAPEPAKEAQSAAAVSTA